MIIHENDIVNMDPEIKAQWVDALRSGKFKQGKGKLRDADDNYCCLGVLSHLAAEAGVVEEKIVDSFEDMRYYYGVSGNRSAASLTNEVCEWSGIITADNNSTAYGRLPFGANDNRRSNEYLDNLNDAGMPFDQIADMIEYWY